MAKTLKTRVNTVTFTWEDNSIDLRAEFEKMELLSEAVGMDALAYIDALQSPRELTEVFYFLQDGSEFERKEIYNAFFSKPVLFLESPEFQREVATTVGQLLGKDKAAILAQFDKLEQEEAAQKKAAS